MAKTTSFMPESIAQTPDAEADPKSKSGKKLDRIKSRQKEDRNIVIEEVLGDFSVQTGAYF
jgi:hypothetical protein